MDKPETIEQLGDILCTYCQLPEENKGVHCYGGEPVMCEDYGCCPEAYESYLEEFKEEQMEEAINKIKEDSMYKTYGIIPNQIYNFELNDCTEINGIVMNFDANVFCIKGVKECT